MTTGDPICTVCGNYSAMCKHNEYPHLKPNAQDNKFIDAKLDTSELILQLAHQQDIIRWLSKAVSFLSGKIMQGSGWNGGISHADYVEHVMKIDLSDDTDELEIKCGLTHVLESGLLEDNDE